MLCSYHAVPIHFHVSVPLKRLQRLRSRVMRRFDMGWPGTKVQLKRYFLGRGAAYDAAGRAGSLRGPRRVFFLRIARSTGFEFAEPLPSLHASLGLGLRAGVADSVATPALSPMLRCIAQSNFVDFFARTTYAGCADYPT